METNSSNLAQVITDLATPLAASLGLAIWGVDVVPAGRVVIRVFAESLEEYNREQSILAGQPSPLETAPLDGADSDSRTSFDESQQKQPVKTELGQNGTSEDAMGQAALSQKDGGHNSAAQDSIAEDDTAEADTSQDDIGQGGITIDQCAELSRLLGLSLEVEDCVESAYVLEVSSPGLERLFFKAEQLKRAVGAKVEATLFKPLAEFPGRRKFIGVVSEVEGDICTLTVAEPESAQVDFPWSMVKKVKQVYVAPEKTLPGKSVKNTRQKKSAGKKNK